jgi:hypothetical protein
MSDPTLTPNNVTLQLDTSYSLSRLFTFDPGTPPSGDSFLGAVAERRRIKRATIANRHLQHQLQAA